jgi:Reverse transcriptase (RNA-dependent DNA polymerase)
VLWIKRRPDGTEIKIKARFCVRGDIQDLDENETVYAPPVVDWGTIHLLLIVAVYYGYYTRQIDFCNAFIQSPLPEPIYLEMTQGFEQVGKVLKVTQSLYGDRCAPKLWFEYLCDHLLSLGFHQSTIDHCLFYKPRIIFIVYVDDGIFVSKDIKLIDQTIQQLHELKFDLDKEDNYSGYLGISLIPAVLKVPASGSF